MKRLTNNDGLRYTIGIEVWLESQVSLTKGGLKKGGQ
jgi:hypothetical protein